MGNCKVFISFTIIWGQYKPTLAFGSPPILHLYKYNVTLLVSDTVQKVCIQHIAPRTKMKRNILKVLSSEMDPAEIRLIR